MTTSSPAGQVAPLRLSSTLNACPRKAVYEATGAPARERTDREERVLFRGARIGQDYADLMAAKYGEAAIERERKVTWELGVGHIDVYLKKTRTAIEVLSSAHAHGVNDQTHGKLLQLVGYMEHDPDVDAGVLVILNPVDFTEELIPVAKTSASYAGLVDEMLERVARVVGWRDTGELPPRVCEKPSDAWGRFCLHPEHCFQGWTPPDLEQLAADETLIDTLARYAALSEDARRAARVVRDIKVEHDELKAVLESQELPPGDIRLGPFEVKTTHVARKATFDWGKAELAGVFEPGLYGDFFRAGATYSTFKVKRVDVTGDEFGDEAPF